VKLALDDVNLPVNTDLAGTLHSLIREVRYSHIFRSTCYPGDSAQYRGECWDITFKYATASASETLSNNHSI
jgi:hypothetical protein